MTILLALLLAVLVGCGVYMLLRRSIVKELIGLSLLGHAINLLLFVAPGIERGDPPIVAHGETALRAPYADPLPQALILTAIVIGFGLQAFAIVLLKRVYQSAGTDDMDDMRGTDATR